MSKRVFLVLVVLVSLLFASRADLSAKPAYKKALAEHFGPLLPKNLNDCRTCHLPEKEGENTEDKPHNSFGMRLKALKKEFEAAGKKPEILDRLQAILDEDSDGDGASNLLEILSGHNPGEPADKPTATELAQARERVKDYLARKDAYRWTPFETVKRPEVPKIKNGTWVHNPIDVFVAAEHERVALKPRPEAARQVLLRRLYLDLIGLPPTRSELESFLADTSPDAYEKVVDRLLASKQYGERWARHWMDVWRYADWAGYGMEVRDSQPHIWRWRDWIIESLNDDKGYDRMIVEMLAADEVAPDDPAALRATGFLVRNWYKFSRQVWLENTVEHTGKAFLGVTMNCAKCHDHFFDAISQKEYFQFRAFFEPVDVRTDRLPGEPDTSKQGLARAFDGAPATPTYLFVRGNDMNPDKSTALPPGVPALLKGAELKVEPVALPKTAWNPDSRDFVIKETLEASQAAVVKAQSALRAARHGATASVALLVADQPLTILPAVQRTWDALALAELDVALADARHVGLVAVLRAEQLEDAGKMGADDWKLSATKAANAQRRIVVADARRNLLVARQAVQNTPEKARPELAKKADAAEKALAAALAVENQPPTTNYTKRAVKTYPQTSTGRRLALARWIADRQNPLTARVAVNHIWLRHFGQPLVPSVFDFGKNGQPATHPALLDWLAAEFMEPSVPSPLAEEGRVRGWSMKHIHRLIVTSSAYRMDSNSDPASAKLDPENHGLWRMNVRRMEAEVVRDGILHLAGQLDPTLGGPDIDHNQGLTSRRRSLYFRHGLEKQMEFLKIFDAANVTECYQRPASIIPQQALALANSTLALSQSRLLATKLTKEIADDSAFIKAAFEQVLTRPPSAGEVAECEKFLADQAVLLADKKQLTPFAAGAAAAVPPSPDPRQRARENLVHVLMNHNDFVTVR